MFVIITLFVFAIFVWHQYFTFYFDYWTKRKIPGPKPSIKMLNQMFVFKTSIGQYVWDLYRKYENEKYIGVFQGRTPSVIIRDLDVARQIMINDFPYFVNRGLALSNEPFGENLFINKGDTWKPLRQNLTPVFTSGKLKNMFYLIQECGLNFQKYVDDVLKNDKVPEIKHLSGKYTLEVICSCAFGIEIEALKQGTNIFEEIGKNIFEPTWKRSFLIALDQMFPGIHKRLNLTIVRPNVQNFFHSLVKKIIEEREGKPKVRQDFMDLILNLKEQGVINANKSQQDEDMQVTITERTMAAQAFIFYAGGFETSSGTMAFMFHELALNPDIQEKLREEINKTSAKHGGLTYEAIQEMRYMNMVFNETLRKYPVCESLFRECVKKYKLPGTDITIDEGVKVLIPLLGFHMDPEIFPNPEKFIPERFAPENLTQGHAYMPFGEGPRICIGVRFAKIQSMLGMAYFLQKFGVRPCARTTPILELHPMTFTMSSAHGIWLDVYRV